MNIGVLAFQGGVVEHIRAVETAAKNLKLVCTVVPVRVDSDLKNLRGLIIPGGESTVLQKLCERTGIFDVIKKIPNIFGTCAGSILLSKKIRHREMGQKSLELMDIEVDRNAYGRQTDSFQTELDTEIGKMNAIFIRAPKIVKVGVGVFVLAEHDKEIVACEQRIGESYYLALSFHPELTTTKFHEYFLKQCLKMS